MVEMINFILTILVTISEFIMAVVEIFRGRYNWAVIFILLGIFYIFGMIPLTWKNYLKGKKLRTERKELKEKLDQEWRKYNENLPKL